MEKIIQKIINNSENIYVKKSTVQFLKYFKKKKTYYIFDTSLCTQPEPMINALRGISLLNENSKLLMINHSIPLGLFLRIKNQIKYKVKKLNKDKYLIIFKIKKKL